MGSLGRNPFEKKIKTSPSPIDDDDNSLVHCFTPHAILATDWCISALSSKFPHSTCHHLDDWYYTRSLFLERLNQLEQAPLIFPCQTDWSEVLLAPHKDLMFGHTHTQMRAGVPRGVSWACWTSVSRWHHCCPNLNTKREEKRGGTVLITLLKANLTREHKQRHIMSHLLYLN